MSFFLGRDARDSDVVLFFWHGPDILSTLSHHKYTVKNFIHYYYYSRLESGKKYINIGTVHAWQIKFT